MSWSSTVLRHLLSMLKNTGRRLCTGCCFPQVSPRSAENALALGTDMFILPWTSYGDALAVSVMQEGGMS